MAGLFEKYFKIAMSCSIPQDERESWIENKIRVEEDYEESCFKNDIERHNNKISVLKNELQMERERISKADRMRCQELEFARANQSLDKNDFNDSIDTISDDCTLQNIDCEASYACTDFEIHAEVSDTLVVYDIEPKEFKIEQNIDPSLLSCRDKLNKEETSGIDFIELNGFLYRRRISQRRKTLQLVVPVKYREIIMKIAHEATGHKTQRQTKLSIISEFYWPNMYKNIRQYVQTCNICQVTIHCGVNKTPMREEQTIIEPPFEKVTIDIVGPLNRSNNNNEFVLTVTDLSSGWIETVPLTDTTSENVMKGLITIFTRIGLPVKIFSDLSNIVNSDLMSRVSLLMSMKQDFSSHCIIDNSDELCDKLNYDIQIFIEKVVLNNPYNWDILLPGILYCFRKSCQYKNALCSHELLHGRTLKGPMGILKELCTNAAIDTETRDSYLYVLDIERRNKDIPDSQYMDPNLISEKYDEAKVKIKPKKFKPGSLVLLFLPSTENKLVNMWSGPFEIVKRISSVNYQVIRKGNLETFHINLMKKVS